MEDPADTHLAEVEVTVIEVGALPAGHGLVKAEIGLVAFAATHKPVLAAAIAKPLVMFLTLQMHMVLVPAVFKLFQLMRMH